MIIIVNKWDLVTSGKERTGRPDQCRRACRKASARRSRAYEERLRDALKFLSYAPVLFVSAATGKGMEKIFPTLEEVAPERRKRIGTGEMNRFLKHVDFERASVPARQRVKIYYMTQAAVGPPTFILFTDRQVKLHFSYQRFLENQIREAFGFRGHADLDQEPGPGLRTCASADRLRRGQQAAADRAEAAGPAAAQDVTARPARG